MHWRDSRSFAARFLVLGIEAEVMYAAGKTVHLVALYAHPEFAYPIVNLMCVGAPVAKNQAVPRRCFRVANGQGHCGDTPLGSLPRHRHIVDATRQQCHQMHPRLGTNHLKHISHLDLDRIYEHPSPVHIEHSHAAYMASEVSLSDEIGQDS